MNFIVGGYINKNTIIHRIDPRIKILTFICMLASVFLATSLLHQFFIASFLLTLFLLARLPLRIINKILINLFIIFIFLLIIGVLSSKTNFLKFSFFFKPIRLSPTNWHYFSDRAINENIIIDIASTIFRLFNIILTTTFLISVTKPLDLTLGLEDIMKPLKWIKFPVHQISMIIGIALRFIPTILQELNKIMNAQASRGVDFKNKNILKKTKSLISLIIPIINISIVRSEDLTNAMVARGYDPFAKRSRYLAYKINIKDILYLGLFIGLLTCSILVKCGVFKLDDVILLINKSTPYLSNASQAWNEVATSR